VSDAAVVVAALLLCTLAVLFSVLASRDAYPEDLDLRHLNALLAAACAMFAIGAGYISALRWRVIGDTSSLRAGFALSVLGLSYVFTDLVPFVDTGVDRRSALGTLGTALTVAAVVLLAITVFAPTIDARARMARRVTGTVALVVGLWVFTLAVPPMDAFRRTSTGVLDGSDDVVARAGLVTILVVLGVASFTRGHRVRSWLWTWFGLMLFGFALARSVGAVAESPGDLWVTGAAVITAVAILLALNGVSEELKLAYLTQRMRLLDSHITAEERAARLRAEKAEREERAHQARSAVMALHAAARNLDGRESNGSSDVSWREAIATEIAMLQRLLGSGGPETTVVFDLGSVVRNVVVAQRFTGLDVALVADRGLLARGRASETAEVLQSLLDNAREHAPGSSVVVAASRNGSWAEVRVEDRGPGITPTLLSTVFDRAVTASSDTGHGLGLYVGRRLMRAQGGDLWTEQPPQRGAVFVLRLPADEAEEVEKVVGYSS
jgi:signal transduction histidine kinase